MNARDDIRRAPGGRRAGSIPTRLSEAEGAEARELRPDTWEDDTIVAVSTATGRGAIGIVRMSGSAALEIARRCFCSASGGTLAGDSHKVSYGRIVDPASGEAVDEVLVVVMRAPRTYTREDIVEVHCHGGPLAQRSVLRLLVEAGARIAEPGEFTRRAFLNGRIDLTQAEGVAAIVAARSSGALRASVRQLEGGLSERLRDLRQRLVGHLASIEATVDFFDEDVGEVDWEGLAAGMGEVRAGLEQLIRTSFLGRALEQGVRTAIVGRPNVGKSSLLNALLMRERAIVTDIPGTTRDTIEEMLEIGGIPIQLVDTAGVRSGGDHVERLGVQRSLRVLEQADLVLAVFDLSLSWDEADARIVERLDPARSIIVANKQDLVESTGVAPAVAAVVGHVEIATGKEGWVGLAVSAVTGEGLDELRDAITRTVTGEEGMHLEEPVLATERQRGLVEEALRATETAHEGVLQGTGEELICEDIRAAAQALGRITGEDLAADLVDEIFSRFCLGK